MLVHEIPPMAPPPMIMPIFGIQRGGLGSRRVRTTVCSSDPTYAVVSSDSRRRCVFSQDTIVWYSYEHPSRKFCCLYVCPTNIGNAFGCLECPHWVGASHSALLSILTPHSAVLASFLLNEELGHLGRTGCALCLLGSLIIVLHAPPDKEVKTVDEILQYAIHPGRSTFGRFMT